MDILKTCFIFLVTLFPADSNPVKDWLKVSLNLYKNAPKLWHLYVEKFAAETLKYVQKRSKTQRNFIYGISYQLPSFTQFQMYQNGLANAVLSQFKHKVKTTFENEKHVCITRHDKQHRLLFSRCLPRQIGVVIQRSSGHITITPSVHKPRYERIPCKSDAFMYRHITKADSDCPRSFVTGLCETLRNEYRISVFFWDFQLNRRLALNLTFLDVQFTSGLVNYAHGTLHCEFGNLTILNIQNQSQGFHFCGHHSFLNLFPKWSNIAIKTAVFPSTYFKINCSFMVQDKDVLVTQLGAENQTYFPQMTHFHSLPENKTTFSFQIEISKIHFIVLKILFNLSNVVAFDGPGYFSKEVHPTSNTFVFSSFHCYLAVLRKISGDKKQDMFSFTSDHLPQPQQTVEVEPDISVKLLKNESCNKSPCIFNFFGFNNKLINVTVSYLTYQGPEEATCKFGGFTSAQIVNNKYMENSILCQNHDGETQPSRSFYSSESALMVVLYWFKEYSQIEAHLILKLSNCKPVQICPCTANYYFHIFKPNFTQFKHYINKQAMGTGLKFHSLISRRYLSFWVTLQTNSCVVIQLSKINNCFPVCKQGTFLEFVVRVRDVPGTNISTKIKGIIQNSLNGSSESCALRCGLANTFRFSVIGRYFFYALLGPFMTKLGFYHSLKYTYKDFWNRQIYSVVDTFFFTLHEPVNGQDWVDITIDTNRSNFAAILQDLTHRKLPLNIGRHDVFYMIYPLPSDQFAMRMKVYFTKQRMSQETETHNFANISVTIMDEYASGEHRYSEEARIRLHDGRPKFAVLWKTCHIFTNRHRYVALQTKIFLIDMNPCCIPDYFNGSDVYIGMINFPSHKLHLDNKVAGNCFGFNSSSTFQCLQLPFGQNNNSYILLEKVLKNMPHLASKNLNLTSWKEAFKLCMSLKAGLPVLTKKSEMEELINLLKFSKNIPILEAVFVGLYTVQKVKNNHTVV